MIYLLNRLLERTEVATSCNFLSSPEVCLGLSQTFMIELCAKIFNDF